MSDSTNPKDALGVRKTPLRFVPPALAIVASDAMADGAAKYGPFNWRETSVRLTVYLEAIERHVAALRDGQDRAEDSGHLHIGHIAACCGIIADAAAIGKLIDDRPTPGPAADMLRERDKTLPTNSEHDGAAAPKVAAETERDGAVVGALAAPAPAPFSGTPAEVIAAELGYTGPGGTIAPVGINAVAAVESEGQSHTAGLIGARVRIQPGRQRAGMLGTIKYVLPDGSVCALMPGFGERVLRPGDYEVLA